MLDAALKYLLQRKYIIKLLYFWNQNRQTWRFCTIYSASAVATHSQLAREIKHIHGDANHIYVQAFHPNALFTYPIRYKLRPLKLNNI